MAVTALEIKTCSPFAQGIAFGDVGPYQQLDGTVHFAVDPDHPSNAGIADLKLAPRDAQGLVRCSADVRLLQPVTLQRGNQRLLLDIVNRGNPTVLTNFNSAVGRQEPGNGFLMRQGYTVVWCGWQDDVPARPGLVRIQVPEAVDAGGQPIAGKIAVTFQPDARIQVQLLSDSLHRPHPARDLHDREATLTVQDHEDAPPQTIPRQQWSFARLEGDRVVPDATHIYMASGFVPGQGLPGGLHHRWRPGDWPGAVSHAGYSFLLALRLSPGGQSVCGTHRIRLQLWPFAERQIPAPLPVSGAQPGRAGSACL